MQNRKTVIVREPENRNRAAETAFNAGKREESRFLRSFDTHSTLVAEDTTRGFVVFPDRCHVGDSRDILSER